MNEFRYFKNDRQLIVGIGSALVDILSHEEDEFLRKTGAVKGGMTLVEKEHIDRPLGMSSGEPVLVPGGSACNTIGPFKSRFMQSDSCLEVARCTISFNKESNRTS